MNDNERIESFRKEYKKLCEKYQCSIEINYEMDENIDGEMEILYHELVISHNNSSVYYKLEE